MDDQNGNRQLVEIHRRDRPPPVVSEDRRRQHEPIGSVPSRQLDRQERGRFRSFLLASLKHFLWNQRDAALAQKRGITGADAYTAEWKWTDEQERDGSAQDVVAAVIAELEAKIEELRLSDRAIPVIQHAKAA
jgi:hypothetical protein